MDLWQKLKKAEISVSDVNWCLNGESRESEFKNLVCLWFGHAFWASFFETRFWINLTSDAVLSICWSPFLKHFQHLWSEASISLKIENPTRCHQIQKTFSYTLKSSFFVLELTWLKNTKAYLVWSEKKMAIFAIFTFFSKHAWATDILCAKNDNSLVLNAFRFMTKSKN